MIAPPSLTEIAVESIRPEGAQPAGIVFRFQLNRRNLIERIGGHEKATRADIVLWRCVLTFVITRASAPLLLSEPA
jgi:hypothetical protein